MNDARTFLIAMDRARLVQCIFVLFITRQGKCGSNTGWDTHMSYLTGNMRLDEWRGGSVWENIKGDSGIVWWRYCPV